MPPLHTSTPSSTETKRPALTFQGGTLVLYDVDRSQSVPPVFQWIKARWRCEAYHYATLDAWLHAQGVRDSVPRWQPLNLQLHDDR